MKNRKIEIKWGIIFVLMMLLWMVMEKLTGLHDKHIEQHAIYTNFIMIPAILIYVLAFRDKRKNDYGGYMTFKQGFESGMIITLVVTLFTPLTQFLTSKVISPDYFKNAIAYSVETGALSLEKAEAFFNFKNFLIVSTISAPIMGAITTVIVALFFIKKRK